MRYSGFSKQLCVLGAIGAIVLGISGAALAGYDYTNNCTGLQNNGSYYSVTCTATTTNNLTQNTNINDTVSDVVTVPTDVDPNRIIASTAHGMAHGHFWGPGFDFSVDWGGGPVNIPVRGVGAGQAFTFWMTRSSTNMVYSSSDITFIMYRKPGNMAASCQASPNPASMVNGPVSTTISGTSSDPWGGYASRYAWDFGDGQTASVDQHTSLATTQLIKLNSIAQESGNWSSKLGIEKALANGGIGTGPAVTLSANPASVTAGQQSTLSWNVTSTARNVFTITATNNLGTASASVTVPVNVNGTIISDNLPVPTTSERINTSARKRNIFQAEHALASGGGGTPAPPTVTLDWQLPPVTTYGWKGVTTTTPPKPAYVNNGDMVVINWTVAGYGSDFMPPTFTTNFDTGTAAGTTPPLTGSVKSMVSYTSITSNFQSGQMAAAGNKAITPVFGNSYSLTAADATGTNTQSYSIAVLPPPVQHAYARPGIYTIKITAYSTTGNYGSGSCTMTVRSGNNAQFVSQAGVPTTMKPGETANVTVTMKNIGTTTWNKSSNYKLGSQNPQDNLTWKIGRVELTDSDAVAPGVSKAFGFTITAPTTLGSYNFQWQMLQEGFEWFGDKSPNTAITVAWPPVAVQLKANDTPQALTVAYATPVTLSWTSTSATSCTAGGDWSGAKNFPTGIESVGNLTASKTYSLTCSGQPGQPTVNSSVAVTVTPPPPATVTLKVTADGSVTPVTGAITIPYNSGITLSWLAANAKSCTASGAWSGTKATQSSSGGERFTNLINSRNFTLVCLNFADIPSAPSTIAVTVLPPPPPTITLTPSSLTYNIGQSIALTWTSQLADTVVSSNFGATDVNGKKSVTPAGNSADYTITVQGPGGQNSATAHLGVNPVGVHVIGDVFSQGNVSGITVDPSSVVTSGGSISIGGQKIEGYPQGVAGQNWDAVRKSILDNMSRLERERGQSWTNAVAVRLPTSDTSAKTFNLNPLFSLGAKPDPFTADITPNPLLPEGGVWVVNGDLDLTGPFTFRNTGTIIVKGKITIHGAEPITVKNGTLGLVAVGRPTQAGEIVIGSEVTELRGIAFFAEKQIRVE